MNRTMDKYINTHVNKIDNYKVSTLAGDIIDFRLENIYDTRGIVYYNNCWMKCHWVYESETNHHVIFSLTKTQDNMADFEEKSFSKELVQKYFSDPMESEILRASSIAAHTGSACSTASHMLDTWNCTVCAMTNNTNNYICSSCSTKNDELAEMCDFWICIQCTFSNSLDTYDCMMCGTNYDDEDEVDVASQPAAKKSKDAPLKCCICDENTNESDSVTCSSESEHVLCNECFEGNLKNQIGVEYLKHFKDHNMKIVCEICRVTDKQITMYTDKQVICNVSDEAYDEYRKACFDVIHVKSANETEERLKLQFEQQAAQPAKGYQKKDYVAMHRTHIIDNILTLKCPSCSVAFTDFEGCFALTCSNCSDNFCGWCLQSCGDSDTCHKHVLYCDYSKEYGSLFSSLELFNECHNEWRYDMITEYLHSRVKKFDRKKVKKAIRNDLFDLGINQI